MQSVSLLDPSIGIQNVIDMPLRDGLPAARELPASAAAENGLEELFSPMNAQTVTESLLRPEVGDGTLLAPERFADSLRACADILRREGSDEAKELVEKELDPLMENSGLLQAYVGLMIGG